MADRGLEVAVDIPSDEDTAADEIKRIQKLLESDRTRSALLGAIKALESGEQAPLLRPALRSSLSHTPGSTSSLKEIIWEKEAKARELGELEMDSNDDDEDEDDISADSGVGEDELRRSRVDLHEQIRRDQAALKVQMAWFMHRFNNDPAKLVEKLHLGQGKDNEKPDPAKALKNMKALLPHKTVERVDDFGKVQREKRLYKLKRDGLASFDDFGVEVATYMRFTTYAGRLILVCLLLNLSNIISNLEGGNSSDLLAKNSLSNSDCLGNVYGIIEALTSALFVAFIFYMRNEMERTKERISKKQRDHEIKTIASFTVLVTDCPPELNNTDALERLKSRFKEFGQIVHVGVALNNRELILAMKRRSELLGNVQDAGKELFRAVEDARRKKAYTDNVGFEHEAEAAQYASTTAMAGLALGSMRPGVEAACGGRTRGTSTAQLETSKLGMRWSSIGKSSLGRREWVDGAGPALRNTLRASLGEMPGMFAKAGPRAHGKEPRVVNLKVDELAGIGIQCGSFVIDWERFGRKPSEVQRVDPGCCVKVGDEFFKPDTEAFILGGRRASEKVIKLGKEEKCKSLAHKKAVETLRNFDQKIRRQIGGPFGGNGRSTESLGLKWCKLYSAKEPPPMNEVSHAPQLAAAIARRGTGQVEFTRQELDEMNAFPLGLRWEKTRSKPRSGTQLQSSRLRKQLLQGKLQFSCAEFAKFRLRGLRKDSYVVGDAGGGAKGKGGGGGGDTDGADGADGAEGATYFVPQPGLTYESWIHVEDGSEEGSYYTPSVSTYSCTGTVFVTFNKPEEARKCIEQGVVDTELGELRVDEAPQPEEVLWENLQTGPRERLCRQCLSTFILFLFTVVGAAVIALTSFLKPNVEKYISPECVQNQTLTLSGLFTGRAQSSMPPPPPPPLPWSPLASVGDGSSALLASGPRDGLAPAFPNSSLASSGCLELAEQAELECSLGFLESMPIMLGSTVFIILGHIIIFILAPLLSELIERPHFFYQRELTIFLKLTFFQVGNVIVSMILMLARDSDPERGWLGGWLEHAAPLVINSLIGDTLIINIGIDLGRPDIRIKRLLLAPYAKTQAKMDRLYINAPDIWLAFRLQLFAKVFLLTLMFSSAMPILLFVVGLYCLLAFQIDTRLLFRVLMRPPTTTHARLMYVMICWLMPLAVLIRLAFAVFIFLGLRCECIASAPIAAAADPVPLLDLAAGAPSSSWFLSGLRPVQTIVIVSSCLLALLLLYFVAREVYGLVRQAAERGSRRCMKIVCFWLSCCHICRRRPPPPLTSSSRESSARLASAHPSFDAQDARHGVSIDGGTTTTATTTTTTTSSDAAAAAAATTSSSYPPAGTTTVHAAAPHAVGWAPDTKPRCPSTTEGHAWPQSLQEMEMDAGGADTSSRRITVGGRFRAASSAVQAAVALAPQIARNAFEMTPEMPQATPTSKAPSDVYLRASQPATRGKSARFSSSSNDGGGVGLEGSDGCRSHSIDAVRSVSFGTATAKKSGGRDRGASRARSASNELESVYAANQRTASFLRNGGGLTGIGRTRAASGAAKEIDISDAYLPPLSHHLLTEFCVQDEMHRERIKLQKQRRDTLKRKVRNSEAAFADAIGAGGDAANARSPQDAGSPPPLHLKRTSSSLAKGQLASGQI